MNVLLIQVYSGKKTMKMLCKPLLILILLTGKELNFYKNQFI